MCQRNTQIACSNERAMGYGRMLHIWQYTSQKCSVYTWAYSILIQQTLTKSKYVPNPNWGSTGVPLSLFLPRNSTESILGKKLFYLSIRRLGKNVSYRRSSFVFDRMNVYCIFCMCLRVWACVCDMHATNESYLPIYIYTFTSINSLLFSFVLLRGYHYNVAMVIKWMRCAS